MTNKRTKHFAAMLFVAASTLILCAGPAAAETLFVSDFTDNSPYIDASGIRGGWHLTANNCGRIYNLRTNPGGMYWNGNQNGQTSTDSLAPTGRYEGYYRHFSQDGASLGTITLANVGDVVSFTFQWDIDSNQSAQMNELALFAVNDIGDTSPGANPPVNVGYRAIFSLNGSDADAAVQKLDWWNTTNPAAIAIPDGWAVNAMRQLQFRIERTGQTEMTITLTDITSGANNVLSQMVDTTDILTTFNTAVFATRNGAYSQYPQTRILGIATDFSPVPEPGTISMILLGGIGAFYRRRMGR